MTVTLANGGSLDRSKNDFYPTPYSVTEALLNFLNLPKNITIWECAAGAGHMVKVMERYGYKVNASDLYSYTFEDFLDIHDTRGDWIITNPPFKKSEDFIRHCLDLKPSGFAMLLKSQYWHSKKRLKLFNDSKPSFVLPLTWRPDFLFGAKSGAPTMEVLWTVWGDFSHKGTLYMPLDRPITNGGMCEL